MKRTYTLTQSVLIAPDPKKRTLRAMPGKSGEQQPAVHPAILSTLGFNPDGTVEKDLKIKNFTEYMVKLRDFAKRYPERIQSIHQDSSRVHHKWSLVSVCEKVTDEIPADQEFTFSETFNRGDITHSGASDWYEHKEKELLSALASGKSFETGWRGCKKEILSTSITRSEDSITCEVSVSDDFDTEGMGFSTFTIQSDEPPETTLERIRRALDEAHEHAAKDKKENEVYRGYSITNKVGQWVETYLQRWNGSEHFDTPPGDAYHQWGWQYDGAKISKATREKLEDWIQSKGHKETSFTVGQWTVKPWKD